MTDLEAIKNHIEECERRIGTILGFMGSNSDSDVSSCEENIEILKEVIIALEEIQKYRALGTLEQLSNSVKEEDVLKFYYCESEDDYYIGKRIDTMYYAKYGKTGFEWFMSRYLSWGKHIVDENTLWKEHTYPSEPKEIPFFEWITGFLRKYCGRTVEELREAVQKQQKKIVSDIEHFGRCPECDSEFNSELMNEYNINYCPWCGQALDWMRLEHIKI